MQEKEFLVALEKLLEQVTRQAGHIVLDIGALNTAWQWLDTRKKELEGK